MSSNESRSLGRRMVAICFLAQNSAIGISAGSFGAVLLALEGEFNVSRAAVSATLGLMYMSLGLVAPITGKLLQHFTVRQVMISGTILSAAGYILLAFAPSFGVVNVAYALALGPGASLMSAVPVTTLLTRWFERDRGRALGVATTPLFILIVPPAAAYLVLHGGRQALFLSIAFLFLLLIPVLLGIAESPSGPPADSARQKVREGVSANTTSVGALLLRPTFWLLSIALGIMAGMGVVFMTHAIPIATSKGVDLGSAAVLISMFGLGALAGGISYGWLADKIGTLPALITNLSIHAILWLVMVPITSLTALLVISVMIGMCMGAVVALHGALISDFYGVEGFSVAMGLSYFLKTPFYLCMAPLTGYLFDISGDYDSGLMVNAGLLALAALIFAALALTRKEHLSSIRATPAPARGGPPIK